MSKGSATATLHSPYNASAGVLGTSLSISAGATSVKLLPSSHVINWNEAGSSESSTINFTTQIQGMEGTLYYDFLVGSNSRQNTTGSGSDTWTLTDFDDATCDIANTSTTVTVDSTATTNTKNFKVGMVVSGTGIPVGTTITAIPSATTFTISNAATATATNTTLNITDEPGPTDAPIIVTVKVRQGATDGTLLAQDVVSIYAIQDGQNTVTGFLTNEAHTMPAGNDGSVTQSSLDNAGGTFKVFYGNNDITTNANTTFSVASTTGTITSAITTPQGVYSVSALDSDSATVTFNCLIKGSLIGGVDSTDDVTISKTYTVAKATAAAAAVAGTSNVIVYAYQRSSSALSAGDDPNQTVTVDLTGSDAGTITTPSGNALGNDWLKAIPSGDDDLYVIVATASGNGSTDDIAASEWTDPVKLTQTGTDGLNSATVQLYQLTASNSAPSAGSNSGKPEGNTTYTFIGGGVSLTTANGWLAESAMPSVTTSNPYLWTTTATAASTEDTDTIAQSEWSTITKIAQPGAAGEDATSNIVTADNPWVNKSTFFETETRTQTTTYNPSTVTITANTQNTTNATGAWTASNSVSFASVDHTIDSAGIASCTIAGSAVVDGMTVTYTLHSDDNSLADYVTLRKFEGNTSNHVAVVENEVHLLLANENGSIKSGGYAGSGTEIRVSEGGQELDYLHTASSNGDLSAGEWYITSISATGITVGNKSSENHASGSAYSRHAQIADHSSLSNNTTDTYTITYNITLKSSIDGAVKTLTPTQRIGKAKQGADGTDAVNSRYPTLYRLNSNTVDDTDGGTFANPRTGNTDWNYAVPALAADGDIIYAITRIFTSDGNAPQESVWSTPAIYARRVDGNTITGPAGQGNRHVSLFNKNDSSLASNSVGSFATPLHSTNSDDGWQYAVPALSADGDIIYVTTRLFTSDGESPQDSTWSTPVIYSQRTDGTDAVNSRYPTLYKLNSSSRNANTGSFADPRAGNTDWNYAVPSMTANGDEIFAMSRIFTSDGNSPQEAAWPTPGLYATRVDGNTVTGPAGQGNRQVNLYNKNDNSLASTTSGTFATPLATDNSNDGWQYSVPTLSANGDIIYVTTRLFTSNAASPQDANWATPTIYSKRTDGTSVTVTSVAANTPSAGRTTVTFSDSTTMIIDDGTNGTDGDGLDIIYKNATSLPSTPSDSSGAPSGWSFTSSAPSGSERTYASFGTRTNNTGAYDWSAPSLVTGQDGASSAIIWKRAATQPAVPGDSTAPPSGWAMDDPGGTGILWTSTGNAPVNSTTYEWGPVRRETVEGNMAGTLTADPSETISWSTADGASYSPTGLTQAQVVTFNDSITTNKCTVTWTYVNVSSSNADYLSNVAETTDADGAFSLGSPSVTLQSGVKYATVVLTHSDSGLTITLGALISQLITGGGK